MIPSRALLGVAVALAAVVGGGALGRVAQAQQPGTIKIDAPANGASVSGPVTLRVTINGVPVKPAAEGDPNAYHYHALVDVDPATVIRPGEPLPTGQANIIHTADPSINLGDLAPGQHTVTVILTRTDHVPLTPNVQDRVTFTVTAPGQAPAAPPASGQAAGPVAAPRVGTGGPVAAEQSPTAATLLLLVVLLTTATAGAYVSARVRR